MRKRSDIYGYGTPSNRFVRPQSQRTENYDDSIDQCHEQEADEQAMAQAMWSEHKYEIQEYGIALYEFDDLQEAVKGLFRGIGARLENTRSTNGCSIAPVFAKGSS